jgi:site-specific recombinase XerD
MTTSDLPPHVYAVRDRHGKLRHRFLRKGWRSCYLAGDPGTPGFHRAYAEALEGKITQKAAQPVAKAARHSLDDLFARSKQSTRWTRKKDRTRHVQSRIIERFLDRIDPKGRRYGERPAEAVTVTWLDRVFAGMHETPAAANVLRKILAGLMDHAVRLGWRTDNPVRFTESFAESKDGFHTWTDAEIDQYRAAHALGTMARLTLELALNTAARRCNLSTLTREAIGNGRIVVAHAKGNEETSVVLLPTTRAAIDALPVAPIKHLVVSQFGKPFTEAGLGNRMRKWCDTAGLPHCSMHGLRKATSRLLAETGATDAEGQSVTGHKKATTFAHYRAKANRSALADRAFSNLASHASFQPEENGAKSDD